MFNSALSYTEILLIQTFRSLCQDEQIRLLAIANALAPAQISPQEDQPRSGEDSGAKKALLYVEPYFIERTNKK